MHIVFTLCLLVKLKLMKLCSSRLTITDSPRVFRGKLKEMWHKWCIFCIPHYLTHGENKRKCVWSNSFPLLGSLYYFDALYTIKLRFHCKALVVKSFLILVRYPKIRWYELHASWYTYIDEDAFVHISLGSNIRMILSNNWSQRTVAHCCNWP